MMAAILTFCSWMDVNAQTKQGEFFSSSWIGAGMSTFVGDIEDAKGRFGSFVGFDYLCNDFGDCCA